MDLTPVEGATLRNHLKNDVTTAAAAASAAAASFERYPNGGNGGD